MAGLPLFFQQVVPLKRTRHGGTSLDTSSGYGFAREAIAVPVLAAEFAVAAREYPIVFVDEGETVYPAAVMGLRRGHNLFVGPDGGWLGRYIPAYLRCYPFVFANSDPNTYTLCIDESYPGLNDEGRGERLFREDGTQAAVVERAVGLLRDYQRLHAETKSFAAQVREWGLLDAKQAEVQMKTGEQLRLDGFRVVTPQLLASLSDERAASLVKSGRAGWLYAHLHSLDNFGWLVDRLAAEAA